MKCPCCGAENVESAAWYYLCDQPFKHEYASETHDVFPPQPLHRAPRPCPRKVTGLPFRRRPLSPEGQPAADPRPSRSFR